VNKDPATLAALDRGGVTREVDKFSGHDTLTCGAAFVQTCWQDVDEMEKVIAVAIVNAEDSQRAALAAELERVRAVLEACVHEEHGLYNLGKLSGQTDEAVIKSRELFAQARAALGPATKEETNG
jgi:hypothetical protein